MMLTSSDEGGVLIPLGPTRLWLEHDPLGIGKQVRYEFEADLWQIVETLSVTKVIAPNGSCVKRGSEHNDYYGFARSIDCAAEDAKAFLDQFNGANLDVVIETTLQFSAAMHDANTPAFYNRNARMFSLPKHRWHLPDMSDRTIAGEYFKDETFTVWKNGAQTDEGATFADRLKSLREMDGGALIRKGDLK